MLNHAIRLPAYRHPVCSCCLRAVRAPVSLITNWFLVLGAFGFLAFYSHRVAVLIQNPDAIGRIVDDLRRAVAVAAKESRGEPRIDLATPCVLQSQLADGAAVVSLPAATFRR
jgi:hypothetical protein